MNNLPIITISRKYGAGGRSLAKALSEKLDIPWYDKDFVKKTAISSGYSEEEILAEGEELSDPQRVLDKILNNANIYTSSHNSIFNAQKEAMLELAKSPCIIVGRCGNIILSEAGITSYNIFLHASKNTRIDRIKKQKGLSEADAKKLVEKTDNYREIYYREFTGHKMDCASDYSISFDTDISDYSTIADCIINLIKNYNH